MSLFIQCRSRDISVVMCGSSVKKRGKLGDALDDMPEFFWLYTLVFLVGKACSRWLEFWTSVCSHWAVRAGVCLPWNGDGAENRISALLPQPLSCPFSLNADKICFRFSRRCLICRSCADTKLPLYSSPVPSGRVFPASWSAGLQTILTWTWKKLIPRNC